MKTKAILLATLALLGSAQVANAVTTLPHPLKPTQVNPFKIPVRICGTAQAAEMAAEQSLAIKTFEAANPSFECQATGAAPLVLTKPGEAVEPEFHVDVICRDLNDLRPQPSRDVGFNVITEARGLVGGLRCEADVTLAQRAPR
jgi:hypothetical protein